MTSSILYIHCRSPLHVGCGASAGAIDLPVARDRATGMPIIPASGLKGSLRATATNRDAADPTIRLVYGPDTAHADDGAGSLAFGDARLLALPMRSLRGTFAWVTSPLLLDRLREDLTDAGIAGMPATPVVANPDMCCVHEASGVTYENAVILEDYRIAVDPSRAAACTALADWLATQIMPGRAISLGSRLCIVHDDLMAHFYRHCTQVRARNVLNDSKQVQNLWYEESLPTESILCAFVTTRWTGRSSVDGAKAMTALRAHISGPVQIGGKETIGHGLCAIHMHAAGHAAGATAA